MRRSIIILFFITLSFKSTGQSQDVLNTFDSLWKKDRTKAIVFLREKISSPQWTKKEKGDFAYRLSDGFFFTGPLDSCISYLDSAFVFYGQAHQDSLQFEALFQSGVYYRRSGHIQKAKDRYQKALDFARNHYFSLLEGDALNAIGVVHYKEGDLVNALEYYLGAMQIFEKAEASTKLGKTYNNIGIIYKVFNHHNKAIAYYQKAVTYRKAANQLSGLYPIFFNINSLYYTKNQPEQAVSASKELLKIGLEKNNEDLQYHAYSMLINDFLYLKQYDSADIHIDKFIQLALDDYDSAKAAGYTARIKLSTDQPKEAIPLLKMSLAVFEKHKSIVQIAETSLSLAEAYLLTNDFNQSIKLAEKAYKLAEEEGDNYLNTIALEKLYSIYAAKGDYKMAFKFLTRAKQHTDSVYNESKASIAGGMEASQKLALKERENMVLEKNAEIQKTTIENQQLLVTASVIGTLLVMTVAFLLIKTQANKKKLAEIEAQINREKANRIEEELAYKNQEIINFAVQITEKNEFLEKLNIQVKKLNGRAKELPEELKQIVELVKAHFSITEQREEFHQHVENVYDAFFQRLESKYPGLSIAEKRLAALIRINLTSKDIASVVNISPKSVDMNRYRLRKKMGLSSEENLNDILQTV